MTDEHVPDPFDLEVASRIPERGVAGRSCRAEYQRRILRREQAITRRHPRLGRLVLRFSRPTQSTEAWLVGAEGEERVGRMLDVVANTRPDLSVLHDRLIPRTSANIDHLAISSAGVHVIDTKRYRGKIEVLRGPRLMVGGREKADLIEGVRWQAARVEDALADLRLPIEVHPVLCFVDARVRGLSRTFRFDDVTVLAAPRQLIGLTQRPGPLGAGGQEVVVNRLAEVFREA